MICWSRPGSASTEPPSRPTVLSISMLFPITPARTLSNPAWIHPSVIGVEFHGVADQIPDDLLEPPGIGQHGPRVSVDSALDLDALCHRRGSDGVERRMDRVGRIRQSEIEPHLAGDDARNVEQIL